MESLLHWDESLLRLINSTWRNDFFDYLMPFLRNDKLWIPAYLFVVLYAIMNFKKSGWWLVLFLICTVALTDLVSSRIIKEHIFRLRPCNNPAYTSWLQVLVGYRPGSSSFTSSHASNHFGVAVFLFITLKQYLGKWGYLLLFWAFSICYAQVYVGVHYPIDVTAGAIIGIVIGYLTGKSFNKYFGLAPY